MSMEKRVEKLKLLIDTDPGVDDALAILMAHRHATVVGLSVAAGNVGLHHTVANALKLVELIGAPTPVFAGCATPLVRDAADAAFVHGSDGFGDIGYAPGVRRVEREHAAQAILRLSHEHAGTLVLVAMAPLTNLALALKLDPSLPQRIARLVVMGGAVTGQGNTSAVAEFNVGFDAEAAQIVFAAWPMIELVDWELCTRHAIEFATMQRWLDADNPHARFYAAISRKTCAWSRERGRPRWTVADALAMAIALEPEMATRVVERHVAIELDGGLTRGMSVVDWDGRLGGKVNTRIVLEVDQSRFEARVAAALEMA
jgi:purine nucleosidase